MDGWMDGLSARAESGFSLLVFFFGVATEIKFFIFHVWLAALFSGLHLCISESKAILWARRGTASTVL
jgi:hypothetical protein